MIGLIFFRSEEDDTINEHNQFSLYYNMILDNKAFAKLRELLIEGGHFEAVCNLQISRNNALKLLKSKVAADKDKEADFNSYTFH